MAPLLLTCGDDTVARAGDEAPPVAVAGKEGQEPERSLPWRGDRHSPVTAGTRSSHGRRADPDPRTSPSHGGRPPTLRRGRVGPLGALSFVGQDRLRADLLQVVPGRVGRVGEDPDRRGALLVGNHAGADPVRRSGDHARYREGARAARLRTGRLLLPHRPRRRHALGPGRRRLGSTGERLPSPQGAGPAGARLPRRNQGAFQIVHRSLPAAPLRPGRLRRDRHARRGARRADRRDRAPKRRCRSSSGCRPWPRRSGSRTFRSRPMSWSWVPSGSWFPCRPSSSSRSSIPIHFDVPPDQERYSKSRVMEESERIRNLIQESVYDMLRVRRSVWFG